MLRVPASGLASLTKACDEKIGGTDCHVITSKLDPATLPGGGKLPNGRLIGTTMTTLWIGKKDHLIHQTRQTIDSSALAMPTISDPQIKATLEKLKKPATPEAIAAWRAQWEKSMKAAQNGTFVFTQTHENISVNKKFSPSDFAR